MQHNLSMTPAMRAVLDALRELGQANANELAEKSGKAISTVHRTLKTFADAAVITEVDTGADPAEGTPTRWSLAEGVVTDDSNDPTDTGLGDDNTAGDADNDDGETDASDAAEDDTPTDSDRDSEDVQPADDADEEPHHGEDNDQDTDFDGGDPGERHADAIADDEDETQDENGDQDEETSDHGPVAIVQQSRPGDRKIMTIKAVLSEHSDDGATLDEIAAESGIHQTTVSKLLAAMEQADAARLLDGRPLRWIAGPTKAAEVDPNPEPPRCPLCLQVTKALSQQPDAAAQVKSLIRPDATLHIVAEDDTIHTVALPTQPPSRTTGLAAAASRRTGVSANADGNTPLGRGELEGLTMRIFAANPGRKMTPQEIATAIGVQFGREVSSGAVRNNCGKLGAAGRILMVSESPWAFVYPAPTSDHDTGQPDDAAEQS